MIFVPAAVLFHSNASECVHESKIPIVHMNTKMKQLWKITSSGHLICILNISGLGVLPM